MKNNKVKQLILKSWFELYDIVKHRYVQWKYSLPIMTSKQTIAYIKKHHCSIARYGDGEFALMLQTGSVGFQSADKKLAEALRNVLHNTSKELLICVPYPMINTSKFKRGQFWRGWSIKNQREVVLFIRSVLSKPYIFGDACVSRPYSGYKTTKMAETIFPLLKELWNQKDVLFVEGETTRLGIGNDLFSNCKSIKRIVAPAQNAFDVYPQILKAVLSNWNSELVIIALGPTATVLASDLSKQGIQALDIGHIDVQYEWFLQGQAFIPLANKYVNESSNNKVVVQQCDDKQYLAEIIAKV